MNKLYRIRVLLLALVLMGCERPSETIERLNETQPAVPPTSKVSFQDPSVTFWMDDGQETSERMPSLILEAQNGEITEDEWQLSDVTATIVSEEYGKTDLLASHAVCNETARSARFTGKVVLKSDDVRVELSEIAWYNAEREARSGQPATIYMGNSVFHAKRLRFLPDKDQLILDDYSVLYDLSDSQPLTVQPSGDSAP